MLGVLNVKNQLDQIMSEYVIRKQTTLNKWLLSMLGNDTLVDRWWLSPNRAFNGLTPQELYDRNELGKHTVTSYLFEHLSK
jgi:hypothetical protein